MNVLTIAVDFDGVIMDPYDRREGRRMGEPVEGAVEAMRALKGRGHRLVVHTVRPVDNDTSARRAVLEWLTFHAVPFHGLTNQKPPADVYLDDRALRFVDWPTALADLAHYRPFTPPARRVRR